MKKLFQFIGVLLIAVQISYPQRALGARPTNTGGVLIYEQAAYDVKNYDISLRVNPQDKSISGSTMVTSNIVSPTNVFVLDLDTPFTVSGVSLFKTCIIQTS